MIKRFILSCVLLTGVSFMGLYGQVIPLSERGDIMKNAELLIEDYQRLLNNLSTEGNTKGDIELFIDNSFNLRKIFYNETDVYIESDLDPDFSLNTVPTGMSIKEYLNEFCLLYKPSKGRSVFLTIDQELTDALNPDISEGPQYKYVRIVFDSQFRNTLKTNDTPFPLRKRVAEIRIDKEGSIWRPYIFGIEFFNESAQSSKEIPSTTPPRREETPAVVDLQEKKEVEEEKTEPIDLSETDSNLNKDQAPDQIATDREEAERDSPLLEVNANAYEIGDLNQLYKYGEIMPLNWSFPPEHPGPVDLWLIKKGEEVIMLEESLGSNFHEWTLEKNRGDFKLRPGTYTLQLRKSTNDNIYGESNEFRVKSSFPTLIAGGAAVAGAAILCLVLEVGPCDSGTSQELPPAPDPEDL